MNRFLPFLLTLLVGCKAEPSKPVPPDAGECLQACEHLRDLHCPEAEPTPAGAPCEVWLCKYAAAASGVSAHCLSQVPSCSDTDRCGR